jgi:hypothetical protein
VVHSCVDQPQQSVCRVCLVPTRLVALALLPHRYEACSSVEWGRIVEATSRDVVTNQTPEDPAATVPGHLHQDDLFL